ncbi:hypothetical protein [uncultured Microbacterium sp.]|uniref:Uncharacterized protein n=1 Tax=uncultured Microbacterium sp. TaxID=191216 RepID=A0A1Y5P3E3_9MICO|nr:hypothetical protein [uncultured Microbacterium sp.]SBS73185.1 conserved hypothetical protein [uncultured Microbacterium sp.]
MTPATARDEPDCYELRVDRHLDGRWAEWFGGLTMTREPDGTTTIRGPVADQAALHGILIKIRDLGMVLLAVRRIDVAPLGGTHNAAPAATGADSDD